MRPSPRQLEYFVALAESRHFGKAALRCHVSQPTLSTQFKLLEDLLGAPLVERTSAGVALTAAGERLLPLARQALESLDALAIVAKTGQDNLGGLIRLGVAPTFGPYFMPYLLPSLKSAYPELQLYIREDRPVSLEQALGEGAVDCALTPDIAQFDGLDTNVVCSEALTVAVPGDHPLSGLAAIPIDLLRGEKLLSLNRGFRLYDDVQALSRAAGAEFREDFEGTSLDALRQMVSIGMGLALFPAAYIASEFEKQPDLTHKTIEGRPMYRKIYLAWRKSSPRQEHFQTLLALARSTVEHMDVAGVVPYGEQQA